MTRRSPGEGSVYPEGDGFRVELRVRGPDGKLRRIRRRTATRPQANALRRRILRESEQQLQGGDATLEAFLERWLDHQERTWAPSTASRARGIARLHLVPALGDVALERLTPQHVQALVDGLLDAGLTPRTVQYVRGVLHSALKQAWRWRMIPENVAALVQPPAQRRSQIEPLTAGQVRRLLADVAGDRLEALYVLALATGMRQGELLGLRWSDVELDAGVLHVRQTIARPSREWIVGPPKTEAGRRSIALPSLVVARLTAHRRLQLEERVAYPGAWRDDLGELLFTRAGGDPIYGANLTKSLQQRAERIGIADERLEAGFRPLRFHDLRHTAASLMLAQGVPPKSIQETLGHADFALTMNVYGHLLEGLKRDVADRMGAFLEGR